MDVLNIIEILKTGNVERSTEALKQLCNEPGTSLDKNLFELVYDMKFHRDAGLKFWAKKVLNKFEVKTKNAPLPLPADAAQPEIPIEELLAKLQSDPSLLTFEDVQRICDEKNKDTETALVDYLRKATDCIQISYLTKALGRNFPSEEMLLVLAPYLKHEDPRVVANTVEGVEAIGSPKAFVFLSQLYDHPDNRVKSNVAVAMAKFNREEAYEMLIKMLQLQGKTHMQLSACYAIMELNESRILPSIPPLLSDEALFPEVLKVFLHFSSEEAIRILTSVLEKPWPEAQKTELEAARQSMKARIEMAAKQATQKKFSPWLS